jgi:cytochrome c oxidase subunit 4
MLVFIILAVLTAIEVGLVSIGLPKAMLLPLLLALAVAKATLVGMYYMHLRFEGRVLRFIAVGPLLLVIFLILPPLIDALGHH